MQGRLIAEKYELEREIGRGGMGSVWVALDRNLHRQVALKLMAPEHLQSAELRLRFEREAKALAKIRDAHIVSVFEYGEYEGGPYIAMELLEGENLETRLEREGRRSPTATLALLRQVAKGLTAAASVGVVHRDLKPANVFIISEATTETVKILDFGIAWVWAEASMRPGTSAGTLLGTPRYMSPEQIRGHAAHHTNDLWSLAVIAYRALTGRLPFESGSLGDLIVRICTDPVAPPTTLATELPAEFDAFFERALAKAQDARFASANAFIQAFEGCLACEATQILVVDDEAAVHEMMRMRFRKQIKRGSYRFTYALDGNAALAELSQNPDIDVIVADINMPGMDGLTLLRHLPAVAPFAKTIMVTAYDDMANIRRAMNNGAFDFLVKPIRFEDLSATIDKTAKVVRERRQLTALERQNQVLRKLVNPEVFTRIQDTDPALALTSERREVSVVHIKLGEPVQDQDQDQADALPAELVRSLNAIFDVIIPPIVGDGGNIDTLLPSGLLVVFHGPDHLERALRSCAQAIAQLTALARIAGPGSAYDRTVAIGVSTGEALCACFGSHASGRLNCSVAGEIVETARQLSSRAHAREVLVCPRVVAASKARVEFELTEGRSNAGRHDAPAYKMLAGADNPLLDVPAVTMTAVT